MKHYKSHTRTRAQESSNAIERMYITMRHLFNRGFYKPMGVSGETLREALLTLRPEIYGSIAEEKVELNGLLYVIDRLPYGIEECQFINLTSDEGYKDSHFVPIIPSKRRRNCYRIDAEQMNIEITRGRSEIYDILTHLTFLFMESHKIMKRVVVNDDGSVTRDWEKLELAVQNKEELSQAQLEVALTHTANLLGRTFEEVRGIYTYFSCKEDEKRFLSIIYWLGKLAAEEALKDQKRIVTFSPVLRERLGQHLHGEIWATTIKKKLNDLNLIDRPIHIISANMHSVMNTLFAQEALKAERKNKEPMQLYELLSDNNQDKLRAKVERLALQQGMTYLQDASGTNINVQIFDTALITNQTVIASRFDTKQKTSETEEETTNTIESLVKPVLIVMDYAFGEQAYETMDELLKPYKRDTNDIVYIDVQSVSIMGKAGILNGKKGEIMIPTAHLFEGTADNYPFENKLKREDFKNMDIPVYDGAMITVLGTSLQNRDILRFFHTSTWNVIGLEMEGAHYQKAIQAAARIRRSISNDVEVRYAYYASDNPLKTGSTLASGGLGTSGVKPTYIITQQILEQILH